MSTTITMQDHDAIVEKMRSQHSARVTDLLEANNLYLERARGAERLLNEANLTIAILQGDSAVKVQG